METLKDLLTNTGHNGEYKCTNRSPRYKEVNRLLTAGLIKLEIAPYGKIFTDHRGKQYTVAVTTAGKVMKFTHKARFELTADDVANLVAKTLSNEFVKEAIKAKLTPIQEPERCLKCTGSGYLPMYKHVCNGVCFDCMGTGVKLLEK